MSANHRPLSKTRRWQAVRRAVFERDGWRCVACGRPGALECDHVTPLQREPGQDAWDWNGLGLDVHIVMDNYATHKTAAVKAWLARRAHWHVHFTPTSASWINQVERWFAELTRKQLQRGVHTSTRQLEADIRAFIEKHNEDPKPFRWTKSADDILAAVKRFCLRVDQNLCHEL